MKKIQLVLLALVAMFSFCSCQGMPPLVTIRTQVGGPAPIDHRGGGYYNGGPQGGYPPSGPAYTSRVYGSPYDVRLPGDGTATYGGQRTNYMGFEEWKARFGNGYGANAHRH